MNATEDRENWATDGARILHEQTVKARELKKEGKSNAEIAEALGISENTVRQLVHEINWGFNCLTQGVHHGRPDVLWNIPLNYAIKIFSRATLKTLVISRIYNDAMQFVENSNTDHAVTTPEWAARIKEIAEEKYDRTLQHKVGEISRYYNNPSYALEMERSAALFAEGKLSRAYDPLHSHDSINMLCRILGVSSSIKASEG